VTRTASTAGSRRGACTAPFLSSCLTHATGCCCSNAPLARWTSLVHISIVPALAQRAAVPAGMLAMLKAHMRVDPETAAPGQVTFPSVWTNTCCSHPLHGQQPPEVDSPADIASGAVPGVKHAAVRKLGHELGIPPAQLPIPGFRCVGCLRQCRVERHLTLGVVFIEVLLKKAMRSVSAANPTGS
jgi:hypothetical protein